MKKFIVFLLVSVLTVAGAVSQQAFATSAPNSAATTITADAHQHDDHQTVSADDGHHEADHHQAPAWTVIPFVLLLLMIATGPLFYEHFWHHHYPKVAVGLAALVVGYYLLVMGNTHGPVHAFFEYVQFIALLTGLYVASGGIMINVDRKGTPLANTALLLVGAVIANIIGTTGASMLLIRPFMRLNKQRIQPYHIVFFIFMVSNVGGCLTPIGDPPLFLGFLKGVPFFWTMTNNFDTWAFAIILLAGVFYFFDRHNNSKNELEAEMAYNEETINGGDATTTTVTTGNKKQVYSGKITFTGSKNFAWLFVVVAAVFLDPNVFDWVPAIHYDGQKMSFIREIIMLAAAFFSYKFADKKALEGNGFNFEPIREVAFIFIGIFGTMMPALELVGNFAKSPAGQAMINHNTLYWGTGALSGFLDNAPTYLNFLAASMASKGVELSSQADVQAFAAGTLHVGESSIFELTAISVAAVFFGAMTYIGNGPNFMVKSIAEQEGIKMPSFFGYIIRYSLPILFPILVLVWVLFFYYQVF
ncbi:sodium:proton antiporter [Persicobacter psychrovividus]|uniref:Citrate transporter n=1 Tax=Persicobacter psychrovividus TaxID=387638 RepID=A0ABM7VAQ2_9BACT|nr:citrate transporter [Persicobacter psychrovividus]